MNPPSLEAIASCAGVPLEALKQKCSDGHICEISQFLDSWEMLTPLLGLKEPDEEGIRRNEMSEEKKKLKSLRKWKDVFSFKATYRALMEALLKIGKADSAYKVCCLLKPTKVPEASDTHEETDQSSEESSNSDHPGVNVAVPNAGVPHVQEDDHSERSSSGVSSGSSDPELPYTCNCGNCSAYGFLSKPCPSPYPGKRVRILRDIDGKYTELSDDVEDEEVLNTKTRTINDEFSAFQQKIRQSFKARNITAKKVVQYLMTKAEKYSSFRVHVAQEYSFLAHCTDRLQQKQNLDGLFEFLTNFWSWYDPSLLDDLIKEFGDVTDEDELKAYSGVLEKYFDSRTIKQPEDVIFPRVSRQGRKVLVLKIDEQWETVPMRQVNRIHAKVAEILRLDKRALFLCSVRRGCLLFKFLVPPCVAFPIPASQRKALKAEGVMMIRCERSYYYKLSQTHKSKSATISTVPGKTTPKPQCDSECTEHYPGTLAGPLKMTWPEDVSSQSSGVDTDFEGKEADCEEINPVTTDGEERGHGGVLPAQSAADPLMPAKVKTWRQSDESDTDETDTDDIDTNTPDSEGIDGKEETTCEKKGFEGLLKTYCSCYDCEQGNCEEHSEMGDPSKSEWYTHHEHPKVLICDRGNQKVMESHMPALIEGIDPLPYLHKPGLVSRDDADEISHPNRTKLQCNLQTIYSALPYKDSGTFERFIAKMSCEREFAVLDQAKWNRLILHDDLLCGEKHLPEGVGSKVLKDITVDMKRHLNISCLLKYNRFRNLLTNDQMQKLEDSSVPPEKKVLQLRQMFQGKGADHSLLVFYLCLMESYGPEPGLKGHYTLCQIIKQRVRFYCKFPTSDMEQQDTERVVSRIKPLLLTHDQAKRLCQNLQLPSSSAAKPPTLDVICNNWLATHKGGDWKVLAEELLKERGLGCSLSGVLPPSLSNPPEVWNYVRKLGENWENLAEYLGFPRSLICQIQNEWSLDISTQLQKFMQVCLVPNCQKRMLAIVICIKNQVPTPIGHPRGRVPVSTDNLRSQEVNHCDYQQHLQSSRNEVPVATAAFDPVLMQDSRDQSTPTMHDNEASETAIQTETENKSDITAPHDLVPRSPEWRTDIPQLLLAEDEVLNQHSLTPSDSVDGLGQELGMDLVQACINEDWQLAKTYINAQCNLEAKTKNGRRALHICCMKGKQDLVELLLQHSADVSAKDDDGNCCLHFRETLKNEALVRLLIDSFAKKNLSTDQANTNGFTPLTFACQTGDICYDSALLLITIDGTRLNGMPKAQCTPLIYASGGGSVKLVELLLTFNANKDAQDRAGNTALIQACLCNHLDIARMLLENGASVHKADKKGSTALAAAVQRNSYEMVQTLIRHGANVNVTSYVSNEFAMGQVEETPLASACARGFKPIAELLIEKGAKIDYMCSDRVPPIGFAIICRQIHIVRYLLQLPGFNKSAHGLAVPLHISIRVENYNAAKLLLDAIGGPDKALEEAKRKNLTSFAQDIEIYMAMAGEEMFSASPEDFAGTRSMVMEGESRVKVEEVLQKFCQISMSAISKKDAEIDEAQVNQVKEKLRKLPDYKDEDDKALTEEARRLTDPEELKIEFSHLLEEAGDAVLGTCADAVAFPGGEFDMTLEQRRARERVEDRYTRVAKLPVHLYLSELSAEREAAKGRIGCKFASMLGFEYGAHHAALMVGDVLIEWDESSLVIPTRKEAGTPVFRGDIQRFSSWNRIAAEKRSAMSEAASQQMDFPRQIEVMVEVNAEKKKLIDDLVSVIARYNRYYYYSFMYRNCQDFVLDAMKAVRISSPPEFNGKLREYFKRLKQGRRKNTPSEFKTHEDLDEFIEKNLETLNKEDREYHLCLYFNFHLNAGMKNDEYICPVQTCKMAAVEKHLDEKSSLFYQSFPNSTS